MGDYFGEEDRANHLGIVIANSRLSLLPEVQPRADCHLQILSHGSFAVDQSTVFYVWTFQ